MTEGTDTAICVVCDFPFGTSTTASKVLQAEESFKNYNIAERGLDIVANYGWIRSGKWDEATLQSIDMGIDRMGIGYRSTPVVPGIEK